MAKCEHIIKQPREGKVIDQFFYILQEYTLKCFIRIRARLEREQYAHTAHSIYTASIHTHPQRSYSVYAVTK